MSKKSGPSKKPGKQQQPANDGASRRKTFVTIGAIIVVVLIFAAGGFFLSQKAADTTTTGSFVTTGVQQGNSKPVILYVNQGNALVSTNNYTTFLDYAKSSGFNTVFFQVYRNGGLLFSQKNLTYFVQIAHIENLKIFFSLYITSPSQLIPASIYALDENGINLDMYNLTGSAQSNLLSTLSQNYKGQTAVTTNDFATTLKPNLLILETYETTDQQYIHAGIIAGVEPLILPNKQTYETQYQYALAHSDGVMVFDYYGLLRTGY
jgi:hypothetical protein